MRVVFALFDTLNRRSLGCYGGTTIKTPNFDRLARHSLVFDNHYVGSLPCIPARREMMTGRYNFLHRSWGPLEPFDHAWPELLGEQQGTYCHLVTDHAHYWEDGGATYHTRYDSAEFIRGQEGDAWKGIVEPGFDHRLGALRRVLSGIDPCTRTAANTRGRGVAAHAGEAFGEIPAAHELADDHRNYRA
jgi:arylsulfatase A-like enzyme